MAGHHLPTGANSSGKEGRDLFFSIKNPDDALRRGALSLPVAAPGGLENRVQACCLAEHYREIHIHAGLDQRGGYHTAGKSFPEAAADLPELLFAVIWVHEGGQMKAIRTVQAFIYRLRGLSGVDDAQDVAVGHELRGQIVPSKFSYALKRYPAKYLLLSDVRRTQLPDGAAGKKFPEDRLQRRLRGCAQNG